MRKIFKNLWDSFSVNSIHEFYADKKFDLVLKHLNGVRPPKSKASVYKNLFRILSLFKTGSERWKDELAFLEDSKALGVFSDVDASYIKVYLMNELPMISWPLEAEIDYMKASQATKKYFPIKIGNVSGNAYF